MHPSVKMALATALVFVPAMTFAQSDAHHPGGLSDQPSPTAQKPASEQCAPMMEMGGTMGEHMAECMASLPPASQAYMRAMMGMHKPMMEAMQATDANVAFVKGMIPHHQAAIDMSRALLQFGDDKQAIAWAQAIITAQQAEIDEMRAWLSQHGE